MPCPKRLRDEQDPDYPDDESQVEGKRQRIAIETARAEACDRVRRIVHQHFGDEIQRREETLMECQSRIHEATQALHLLRYLAVSAYYTTKTATQQTRLHPAVKKLVGQQGARNAIQLGISDSSIRKSRNPLLTKRSDSPKPSTSTQLSKSVDKGPVPTKQPRYVAPKEKESTVVSPPRAASHKVKKRLLVGNISKWLCEELREGAATHKWMMYVRGPPENPDISNLVEKVRFYLHSSYQPHDIIEVSSSPFHLSRRGWGEFPVRLQIHFRNSENKPLDVIHQLRLDRTYTGLQTLGAETLVDVWLYDDQKPSTSASSTSSRPPSLQPIKQETLANSTESSGGLTIKQEPQVPAPKTETSPASQASRSLLKQFHVINSSSATSASSIVKSVLLNVKSEVSRLDQTTAEQFRLTNVSPNKKISNSPQIITTSQANLARFLCGQIKVEPGTSSNTGNVRLSDTSSSGIVKSDIKAVPKPVNAIVINKDGEATVKNVQTVSGSSLLKTNFRTINDLSLLQGKKIIQLKPVASSNQAKSINVPPIQGNQVLSLNQNKTIQVMKSASLLKSAPSNGVNSLTNGTKLMFPKGTDNRRVIIVRMDKDGKFLTVNQQGLQPLATPPLLMFKKPPPLISTSPSSQVNKATQLESKSPPSIKIEPNTLNNSSGSVRQIITDSANQGNQSFYLTQRVVDYNNRGVGSSCVAGNKVNTVTTNSGLNMFIRKANLEEEKMACQMREYEQHLRQLECRTVDDADLALGFLLRKLPLIASKDEAYCRVHPYIVPSAEIFSSWHIGKQRAFEAMRATLVRRLLIAQGFPARTIWEISRWSRQHGFSPLPADPVSMTPRISIKEERRDDMNLPRDTQDPSKLLSSYSEPSSVLSWLASHVVDKCNVENEIVDVEAIEDTSVTKNSKGADICNNKSCDETDQQCKGVQNAVSELGIVLNNQSATMIAEVGKLLVEDLVRRALAESCKRTKGVPASIELSDVKSALVNRPEFDIFSNNGLGIEPDLTLNQAYNV